VTNLANLILPLSTIALFAIFGYFFLPLNDLNDAFKDVNYWVVIPAIGMYFLSTYFRSVRWRVLLSPIVSVIDRPLFPVVVVGQMAGSILPGKFGGIVRAWYLGAREEVSAASALGTVVAERLLDAIAFYVLILVVVVMPGGLLSELSGEAPSGEFLFIVLSLIPLIPVGLTISIVAFAPIQTFPRIVDRMLFFAPTGLRTRLVAIAERLAIGFAGIRSARLFARAMVLSIPILAFEVASLWTIGVGFNLEDSFDGWLEFTIAMMLFTAVNHLGRISPSVGGLSGTSTLFGAATLVALGIPDAKSGAFTLTSNIILIFPTTLLGLGFIARDQMSLRTLLFRRGERSEPAS
jgi:uncharacterized protein (TIRG00374 family)